MRYFLVLWLATLLQVAAENQFISPRNHSADGPGKYSANSRWALGSSQLIAFQTSWKTYRIELWQQPLGSAAKNSSNLVYSQNGGQDMAQSFYWTVQTYELLLSDSPVFFLELHDNNSTARQTSAYFNITVTTAPPPPVSSKTSGSFTALGSSTTSSASTASTMSTETSFPASNPASCPNSCPSERIYMNQGLSAGAAAGIGIGVSLSVILVACVAGFFMFKKKRHHEEHQEPIELPACELQGSEPVPFRQDTLERKSISKHGTPRQDSRIISMIKHV
ncbi:hypothetical protein F5Y03DRAFT_263812 [Xylaria venustula]|nr:hypothetical protein F5Y03DRAFT_263812 [Xylaria venustula]